MPDCKPTDCWIEERDFHWISRRTLLRSCLFGLGGATASQFHRCRLREFARFELLHPQPNVQQAAVVARKRQGSRWFGIGIADSRVNDRCVLVRRGAQHDFLAAAQCDQRRLCRCDHSGSHRWRVDNAHTTLKRDTEGQVDHHIKHCMIDDAIDSRFEERRLNGQVSRCQWSTSKTNRQRTLWDSGIPEFCPQWSQSPSAKKKADT